MWCSHRVFKSLYLVQICIISDLLRKSPYKRKKRKELSKNLPVFERRRVEKIEQSRRSKIWCCTTRNIIHKIIFSVNVFSFSIGLIYWICYLSRLFFSLENGRIEEGGCQISRHSPSSCKNLLFSSEFFCCCWLCKNCLRASVCVWQQSCMIPLSSEPTLLYCDLTRCRTLGDLVEPKLRRPTRRALVLAVIQSGPGFGTFRKNVSAIFAHVVSRAPVILWFTEKEKLGCCCRYRRSWRWCARSEWTTTTNWGEGRSYLQPHKCTNASRKEKE